MSKRIFVPEPLGCLEGRAMLSGATAHHGPVALSGLAFNLNSQMIRGDFEQYALGGNFKLLQTQIAGREAAVPFARVDGLGPQTTAILNQMRAGQANGATSPVTAAFQQLSATIKADVDARIADGTVTISRKKG